MPEEQISFCFICQNGKCEKINKKKIEKKKKPRHHFHLIVFSKKDCQFVKDELFLSTFKRKKK